MTKMFALPEVIRRTVTQLRSTYGSDFREHGRCVVVTTHGLTAALITPLDAKEEQDILSHPEGYNLVFHRNICVWFGREVNELLTAGIDQAVIFVRRNSSSDHHPIAMLTLFTPKESMAFDRRLTEVGALAVAETMGWDHD